MASGSAGFGVDISSDADLFRQPYDIVNCGDARQSTPAYPPLLHSAMVAVAAAAAAGYPQPLTANPMNNHPLNLTANPTDYQYRYNPFNANDVCRIPSYYPYYQYQQQQHQRDHASLYALTDQTDSGHQQSVNPSTSTLRSPQTNGSQALQNTSSFGCSTAALPTINPTATTVCLQASGPSRGPNGTQPPSVTGNHRQPQQSQQHHQQRNLNTRSSNATSATKSATGKSGSRGRKSLSSDEAFLRQRQEFDELVKARTDKLLSDGLVYGTQGELRPSSHSSTIAGNGNLSGVISTSVTGTLDGSGSGSGGGASSPNYKKLIQAVLDAKKSTLLRSPSVVAIIERQQRTLNAFKKKTDLFFVNSGD